MADRLDCEPVPSSIRSARLFVVDKLQGWRCDDLVDSVALLTSELATNAVMHTGQPYSVRVVRRGAGVRVEVADQVRDLPRRHRVVDLDRLDLDRLASDDGGQGDALERGFSGLGIVERLATAWGSDAVAGNGKVVWFELEPPPTEEGERRARVSDLSELRSPEPPSRRAGAGRVVLVLLVIALFAVGAFFLFGGSADVDTEGDLEVPEVDVDVNAPDVDVDTSQAPPASADAG